jgi:hypothetical protein
MARRRMGAHGSINTWTDDRIRMTIRPEPRAFTVDQVAAIIAYKFDLLSEPDPYSEYPEATYQETWRTIMEENPTKKEMMDALTDCWYIANYENYTACSIRIDKDLESHQAMIDFILMKFPKFRPEDA